MTSINQQTAFQSDQPRYDSDQLSYDGVDLSHLALFDGHQLNDLKDAQLMNRVDTKFLIPISELPGLLVDMLPHYSALDINGTRLFSYENVYFDTPDYDFYYMHHQGKLNRYKVRHRTYSDTGAAFLEVKHKNSKARTIKTRIYWQYPCLSQQYAQEFLTSRLGAFALGLQASQQGKYQRIALANEASGERLTLDLNLSFKTLDNQKNIVFSDFFIAELKQGRFSLHSPFARLMGRMGIRPTKFSKYCIGSALLNPSLKSNRFKPVITSLRQFYSHPCYARTA